MTHDGRTIKQLWSPADIALRALEACNAADLKGFVLENLAASAQDYVNESNLSKHVADMSASTFWSQFATAINHEPNSEEFDELAHRIIVGEAQNAQHSPDLAAANAASEIGRGLSRHVSEKSFANVLKGGKVGDPSLEGDKIDVMCDAGNIQVQTCFASSDNTTGKKAADKFDDEIPENVDYYVVLHFDTRTDSNEFGVAVNDLSNGIEREGQHANSAARNAQR
jgi:hypothetical protein